MEALVANISHFDKGVVAHFRALPPYPKLEDIWLIQGGMGVGVSNWELANKTARHENVLGTVSGVAAHDIVLRTLQCGDPGGHMRRVLSEFPDYDFAEQLIADYFVEGGIDRSKKFKFRAYPAFDLNPSRRLQKMMVASGFVLGRLSREGHDGLISVNLLEKVQMNHPYNIYGLMLAGVHFITVGAGIPKQIIKLINDLWNDRVAIYKPDVDGGKPIMMYFDPEELFGRKFVLPRKPGVLAIVSSVTLARMLIKACPGEIAGFIIEAPIAGGHNAPSRNKGVFNAKGEPVYDDTPAPGPGQKGGPDWVDLGEFRKFKQDFGIPFWLAGGSASPEGLAKAWAEGANGVQVGSAFALCSDSGMLEDLRKQARKLGYNGQLEVITSLRSPTGYPFKVALLKFTLAILEIYKNRDRSCSICALRTLYNKNGEILYRCAAEPINLYEAKGGDPEYAELMICLCNGLLATIGLGNWGEPPLVTLGDVLDFLRFLMRDENDSYDHAAVINWILSRSQSKYWWA